MIDFHTHILPEIDDGSRNLDTTLEMLDESRRQGVEVMIATPHFYAEQDTVDRFLSRRDRAMERVYKIHRDIPKIIPGAEVAWFDGISKARQISSMTIQDTGILLLELPFCTWDNRMLEELKEMTEQYQIVLAHLERYMNIPGNRKALEYIYNLPLHVQVNAESLVDWKKRRKVLKMIKKGQAHLLGSDCHGMHRRSPNLLEGRRVIEKRLGAEYLDKIDQCGAKLLQR